jgi:hypothetical protein
MDRNGKHEPLPGRKLVETLCRSSRVSSVVKTVAGSIGQSRETFEDMGLRTVHISTSNGSIQGPARFWKIGIFDGDAMKRSIPVAQEFLFDRAEAVVELAQQEVGTFALELTLLVTAMTDSVSLRSPGGKRIELIIGKSEKWGKVAKVSRTQLRFELSHNEAEYLQAVLLRAYRDEMAEVNHIHIEARFDDESFDFTLLFQAYKPPMSPEEAARVMGD